MDQKALGDQISRDIITKIPFLRDADSNFLCSLVSQLKPLKGKKGEKLFSKDEYPTSLYIIVDGRINCLYNKKELIFKTFVSGAYLGEIEIFQNILRKFTAKCEVETSLLVIDRENFISILNRYPK